MVKIAKQTDDVCSESSTTLPNLSHDKSTEPSTTQPSIALDNGYRDDRLLYHQYDEWLTNYLRSQTCSLLSVPLDARIVSLCGDHWTCTFNKFSWTVNH